jgi:hypothetical protein
MARRSNLGDNFSAIRDEHALARPHASKIFAEPVLQLADTYGLHTINVDSRGYIVNAV